MSKKRKSNFREKVNKDRERQKKQSSSYGYLQLPKGTNIFKEEEGRIKLDIIPYEVTDEHHMDKDVDNNIAVPGELWYKKPIRIHRNIGVDNDTVICLTTFGKKCPICEYRKKLMNEKADKEDIKALNYSFRNLYNVIPRGHKKFEEEIHIWDVAQGNFQAKLNEELQEDDDNAIFPDIEEGKTLRIRFNEESIFNNKFYEAGRIDFEDRDEALDESILDDAINLDEILKVLSYKELDEKFLGVDDDDTAKEEVDDTPKRKRKPIDEDEKEDKKPTRRKKDEDEDDEKPKRTREDRSEKKNKCPHDYKFGKDFDSEDECDNCDLFDACSDKNDELNA